MADEEPDTMREDIEKSWDEQFTDWVKSKIPGNKRKKKLDDILSQDPYSKPAETPGTRG